MLDFPDMSLPSSSHISPFNAQLRTAGCRVPGEPSLDNVLRGTHKETGKFLDIIHLQQAAKLHSADMYRRAVNPRYIFSKAPSLGG